ncbi:hypothetical protein ACHQM5_030347 [Ranunculus cassubicifolius]
MACLYRFLFHLLAYVYRFFVFQLNPFWIQISYFLLVSLLGFFLLKGLKPKTNSFMPKDIDILFMSVSSVTVSSMSTVEMEVFSNSQLVFITILMLVGGEVFTSMLGLQFAKSKFCKFDNKVDVINIFNINCNCSTLSLKSVEDVMEMGLEESNPVGESENNLKYNSIRYLGYVVLGYLAIVLVTGSIMVAVYLRFISSASDVLKKKGLQQFTFTVFTVVSTFASCGFVPTNENMVVFKNNSGLLLILIPQVLLGNTLYPSCLRFVIWLLGKLTRKAEFEYMLKNTGQMGYLHLLPRQHSLLLVFTVFGFILIQFILFCAMEWSSGALDGMKSYHKIVGALFQTINTRHTGESIVDLSIISPAVLVVVVVMMYLPPYTSFLPNKDNRQHAMSNRKKRKQTRRFVENLLLSPLSYLAIFLVIICITERKKMKSDPLNFSLFNLIIEVISAYGNVGFSTGYSCGRQINHDTNCQDKWYGLSGRMSNEGKMVIILVMFFGRLKKYTIAGGRAWKLL